MSLRCTLFLGEGETVWPKFSFFGQDHSCELRLKTKKRVKGKIPDSINVPEFVFKWERKK